MATRKVVPRADNEGGVGTALKRWASAFFVAVTADAVTVPAFSVAGYVKNTAGGVLSGGNALPVAVDPLLTLFAFGGD